MSVLNRLSPGRDRTRQGGQPPEPDDTRTTGARAPAGGSGVETTPAPRTTVPAGPMPGLADTQPQDRTLVTERQPVPTDRPLPRGRRRPVEEEVVVTRWSPADAIVVLVGAALAVVGIVTLVRAGIDDSWYQPRVDIARADHTALLGALETGAGCLIALAGVARSRVAATFLGAALAVAGAVAALETSRVERELAIEEWWAWVLVAGGVVVALMGLVPRRARVRRYVDTPSR